MPNPSGLIGGIADTVRGLFKGRDRGVSDKTAKPDKQDMDFLGTLGLPLPERIKKYIQWYYREAQFEKIQFSRKWMRNALMFQGYHELEWSEINVAWEAVQRDTGDYSFPNNYFRSLILYNAALQVKNSPVFVFRASNDDFQSQQCSKVAKAALEVIKENIQYDYLRVIEAIWLNLFGNAFRHSYYSLDPRYGSVTTPVYQDRLVQISPEMSMCPGCQQITPGQQVQCPQCQQPIPPEFQFPANNAQIPEQVGHTKYAKGQEVTDVVSPLEVYVRSSSPNLWQAPYLIRARVVDKVALQAAYADKNLGGGMSQYMQGGEEYAAVEDLSLIYQQSLADLPGDPTQYAAWYERATGPLKSLFLQGWIRPALYWHDKEMRKEFPDGLYGAMAGTVLVDARNETLDDHWVHFQKIPVPGRFWADGMDDLVPMQLQFNETERMQLRNQAYASAPHLVIDSQRVDKSKIVNDPGEIIEVKTSGRPIGDSIKELPGMPLPQDVWEFRNQRLQDMIYHSNVFGSAIGSHQPGVNTFGGQEQAAARAEMAMSPLLLLYKEANEKWAIQVLKLAAENWLDDRVAAVTGINGRDEFQKIRGKMLDLDMIKVVAQVVPVDPSQQAALGQAVMQGLLNPQDPRVQLKALELFQLPTELSSFGMDARTQWKEIDKMKAGQPVQPMLIRDNDMVHTEVCRTWLNSDEADESPPQIVQLVVQHMQAHLINASKMNRIQGAIGAAGQQAAQQVGGQAQQAPPQRRGGQVPANPAARQQRAMQGQVAKPNRPQPPGGNQFAQGRRGQSVASMRRRAKGVTR